MNIFNILLFYIAIPIAYLSAITLTYVYFWFLCKITKDVLVSFKQLIWKN